jgi:hypothetical protein
VEFSADSYKTALLLYFSDTLVNLVAELVHNTEALHIQSLLADPSSLFVAELVVVASDSPEVTVLKNLDHNYLQEDNFEQKDLAVAESFDAVIDTDVDLQVELELEYTVDNSPKLRC